jgi:[ribosomal protein S18]-alanine N-acetyltransferase
MFCEHCVQNRHLLRPMIQDDLDEVLAIEQASFLSPWTRPLFIQELSSPIARHLTLWTTMHERQVLAGYMIFWIVANEVHLQKIAVRPEFQRRNAATCLMKALFQSARDEQCRTVILEVRRSNTAALKLYEKFGLTIKGVRPCYYSEQGEDALILGTDLPDPDDSAES